MKKRFSVLVIGYGHVGEAIAERAKRFGHKVQWRDKKQKEIARPIDVLHICYPHSKDFVDTVVRNVIEYCPKFVIIESTVSVHTTRSLRLRTLSTATRSVGIVHSPFRGNVRNFQKWVKFVGAFSRKDAAFACKYYKSIGIKAEYIGPPEVTELGKLVDTSFYAVCIAYVQEVDRMCKRFGTPFDKVWKRFSETFVLDPNYKIPRPYSLYPGVIGKHCLPENLLLLNEQFPSKLLEAVIDSNERRRKELG